MTWISVGIVASALVAFTACGNSTTGAGGTGGTGTGGTGTGGNGSGGGTGGGTGGSTTGPDCACACGAGTPTALVCNDPAHPSFCSGTAPVAGGMCETDLKTNCNFSDADIAALGCM
jgi:hypothetical protein